MGWNKNLLGQKFGRLTVISRGPIIKTRATWDCVCSCGKTKRTSTSSLVGGNTKSCGCIHKERMASIGRAMKGIKRGPTRIGPPVSRNNLTGIRFGMLVPIKQGPGVSMKPSGRLESSWICRCDCGTVVNTLSASLLSGNTKSCGCQRNRATSERFSKVRVGQKYGNLTVDRIGSPTKRGEPLENGRGRRQKNWICKCDCGKEKAVSSESLVSGNTRSCGCLHRETVRKFKGPDHPQWKGGRFVSREGYIILNPMDGTRARGEHILAMERKLGRRLFKKETVHHKNGVRSDNRIENLELWASNHPSGQRISDQVTWAKELLARYEPTALDFINQEEEILT